MAGALTERDFVAKLEKAGFGPVRVHERQPLGIDELSLYPLFTPDLVALMRRHIPPAAQREVGVVVVVSARLPHGSRERRRVGARAAPALAGRR